MWGGTTHNSRSCRRGTIAFLKKPEPIFKKSVEKSVERAQRTLIKLALGIPCGIILFVFIAWGACRFYGVVESRHVARRAAAYLGGGELRQAALSARRALQLNPSGTAAIRVLADVAERANDRSALDWRRETCELAPDSIEDTLALANCALQFNDVAIAEKTLRRVNEKAHQTAEFHVAAARLAEAKRKSAEAEGNWAKAVGLAPENKSYQLQLGLALLRMEGTAKREAGLSILEQLRHDEKQRGFATRALIADGVARHADPQKLADMAGELQSYPEAIFIDRILYLEILRQLHGPQFTAYLTNIEKDAVSKPTDLAPLLSWMTGNGMSLLAIDFARTVPNDVLNKWPVPLGMAEAYAKVADWEGLEAQIRNTSWGQFDFLRRAYFALALRGQAKPVAADREWNAAKKEASSRAQSLVLLTRTIIGWRWMDEAVDLLWALSKDPGEQKEALRSLYQHYVEVGDTPGLYRVLLRLAEAIPGDLALQNNLAQIALVLDADIARAQRLAVEVYRKEPANPAYVSTYAFSIYKKGDAPGAARIMESLNVEQLQEPSIAAYYGVILIAAGENEKAREYLKLGDSAKLLPEEKALIAKAESALK